MSEKMIDELVSMKGQICTNARLTRFGKPQEFHEKDGRVKF